MSPIVCSMLLFGASFTLTGCDNNDNVFEDAGEEIDDAMDDAADEIDDAVDELD